MQNVFIFVFHSTKHIGGKSGSHLKFPPKDDKPQTAGERSKTLLEKRTKYKKRTTSLRLTAPPFASISIFQFQYLDMHFCSGHRRLTQKAITKIIARRTHNTHQINTPRGAA